MSDEISGSILCRHQRREAAAAPSFRFGKTARDLADDGMSLDN